jgi:hypothetical protein
MLITNRQVASGSTSPGEISTILTTLTPKTLYGHQYKRSGEIETETYKEPVMRIRVTPTFCIVGKRRGHNNQMGKHKRIKSVVAFRPAIARKLIPILTHVPGAAKSQSLRMGWQR